MIVYGNCRYLTNVEKFSAMLKLLNKNSMLVNESKFEEERKYQFFIKKEWENILHENKPEMN